MASNTIQMNISSIDLSYIKKNTMDIEINKIGTLIREQRISRGIIQKKLGDKEGITKDINPSNRQERRRSQRTVR